jgi:surface antigen
MRGRTQSGQNKGLATAGKMGATQMLRSLTIAALVASLMLAGCEGNKQDSGLVVGAVAGGLLGNTVGRGGGRVAATMIGAVVGGIVGSEIGRSMDKQDRILAQQAEYDAFERGPPGRPVHWRNPDNGRYGDVVVIETAPRGGYYRCRDYTHTIYIDGRPQTMRGTACRNPDGTWHNVA